MATDYELIKIEVSKIKERYDIDIDDSAIILEVLKEFNGKEKTFFADIDTKKIKEYLFTKEKEKMNEKLYELTGRKFNDTTNKVPRIVQETDEWKHSMFTYFST